MKSQEVQRSQQANAPKKVLTLEQARKRITRTGKTIKAWAHEHGFDEATVAQVLRGHNKGSRGVGHKIAVTLGIKDGEIVEEGSDLCAQRSEQDRNLGEEVPTIKNAFLINGLVGGGHG